jgi:hypothetical protein
MIAESGFEPLNFKLPLHCYNHYTNSGDENQFPTWPAN